MDEELEQTLAPLQELHPSEKQIGAWQKALQAENIQRTEPIVAGKICFTHFSQLAASLFLGVIIGAWLFNSEQKNDFEDSGFVAQENATIEVIYTKL